MISIDRQKCDGCGICVDICPTGAITVQDNIAAIEYDLCEDCQVCVDECPQGAILLQEQISLTKEQPITRIPASKVEVIPPESENGRKAASMNKSLIAAFGSAIVEVLPRLASLGVDWLERRSRSVQTSNRDVNSISSANRNVSPRGIGRRSGRGQGGGRGQGQGRGRGQGKNRRQRGNRR